MIEYCENVQSGISYSFFPHFRLQSRQDDSDVLLHSAPLPGRPADGLLHAAAGADLDDDLPLLLRRQHRLQEHQVRPAPRALSQLLRPHHDRDRQVPGKCHAYCNNATPTATELTSVSSPASPRS